MDILSIEKYISFKGLLSIVYYKIDGWPTG